MNQSGNYFRSLDTGYFDENCTDQADPESNQFMLLKHAKKGSQKRTIYEAGLSKRKSRPKLEKIARKSNSHVSPSAYKLSDNDIAHQRLNDYDQCRISIYGNSDKPGNSRSTRVFLLLLAIVFHICYIYSIFDIYFVSPIVSGMRPFSAPGPPPAKRVVLIVGDGLRADKTFQWFPDPDTPVNHVLLNEEYSRKRPLAPFLRSKVLDNGTFGVSHTRVPTESRPGHVAIIAGLYEDVSAVTSGWKLNPVNFDSVFNRSSHTWSWGSPDILPMFKEGSVPGRVDAFTYAAEDEDFTADSTKLDTWVFDRVKNFFSEAKHSDSLNTQLHQPGVILFLHLLGLDTSGHAHRPYSREYLSNIKVVDDGIKQVCRTIDEFFNDSATAYIFTADHGMSDWGSHGDGHPDNTRTPLIAWGAGIAKPRFVSIGYNSGHAKAYAPGHEDGFSHDWKLDNVTRNDVLQADIAALMAYLCGLSFPVNSVGILPIEYLAVPPVDKAKALLANAMELLEMYRVKELVKRRDKLWFRPYQQLEVVSAEQGRAKLRLTSEKWDQSWGVSIPDDFLGKESLLYISELIQVGRYESAIEITRDLMRRTLQGLGYLQTYDWLFLRSLVALGYIGWVTHSVIRAYMIDEVYERDKLTGKGLHDGNRLAYIGAGLVFGGLVIFLLIERSPLTYYGYAVFPIIFWTDVWNHGGRVLKRVNERLVVIESNKEAKRDCKTVEWSKRIRLMAKLIVQILGYIAVIEVLVKSYFDRKLYSLMYGCLAVWPWYIWYGYNYRLTGYEEGIGYGWTICCIMMSIFTLLQVVKTENLWLIMSGGILMLGFGMGFEGILECRDRLRGKKLWWVVWASQMGLIGVSVITTYLSVKSLQDKQGVTRNVQLAGWGVLLVSIILTGIVNFAEWGKEKLENERRLLTLFLGLTPTYILLSVSYEGLFYVTFCATLTMWIEVERIILGLELKISRNKTKKHILLGGQERIALMVIFFVQSAFFSTGNVASISSFSLDAVYRLVPIFSPWTQGALLMGKIIVPLICVSASWGLITQYRLLLLTRPFKAENTNLTNKKSNSGREIGFCENTSKTPVCLDGYTSKMSPKNMLNLMDSDSQKISMLVAAVSGSLALRFFFLVKDEGSWLEIGQSISHYVIASLLGFVVTMLQAGAKLFR